MVTKQYFTLVLLSSWLCLSGEVMAAPVRKIAAEQALPEVNTLQQFLPSGADIQSQDPTTVDQLYPDEVAPDTRVKPEQRCESFTIIAVSCEPAPGSPLSAFPVVSNPLHFYRTISSGMVL